MNTLVYPGKPGRIPLHSEYTMPTFVHSLHCLKVRREHCGTALSTHGQSVPVSSMAGLHSYTYYYKNQEKYTRFAKAYELYFDPSTRFMRGLDSKGEWRSPFSPRASNHRSDDYCEGNAWQWTWFTPHDIEGLVELMGGEQAFVGKLDSLFTADSSLEGDAVSADISGLIGQYAHGNEPSHHIIHMYGYSIPDHSA